MEVGAVGVGGRGRFGEGEWWGVSLQNTVLFPSKDSRRCMQKGLHTCWVSTNANTHWHTDTLTENTPHLHPLSRLKIEEHSNRKKSEMKTVDGYRAENSCTDAVSYTQTDRCTVRCVCLEEWREGGVIQPSQFSGVHAP